MERTMHLPLGSVSLTAVQGLGWLQSKLDPCLFSLRDGDRLVRVLGVYVGRAWGSV